MWIYVCHTLFNILHSSNIQIIYIGWSPCFPKPTSSEHGELVGFQALQPDLLSFNTASRPVISTWCLPWPERFKECSFLVLVMQCHFYISFNYSFVVWHPRLTIMRSSSRCIKWSGRSSTTRSWALAARRAGGSWYWRWWRSSPGFDSRRTTPQRHASHCQEKTI